MHTKKLYHRIRFWAGILLVQFLLFYVLSYSSIAVNIFSLFFEWKKFVHQWLSSKLPFSIGDVFYIVLAVLLIWTLYQWIVSSNRKTSVRKLLVGINLFYFIYQWVWGMLYFQPPIINQLSSKDPSIEDAKHLSLKYLNHCKQLRNKVKENRDGVFEYPSLANIKQNILQQQYHLPKFLDYKTPTNIDDFKSSLFAPIMAYTGILGYYNPFTAEAQYHQNLPQTYIPFTLAHESAHQLGYAREEEANFIGYLIGIQSQDKNLQYSTAYFTLKSLLSDLYDTEPEFVEQILNQYSEGMKRDRAYEMAFREVHRGKLEDFFGWTNHLFLKSNRQDGRITYSYFTRLLLKYEAEYPLKFH
ncbi:DUF3810 domain-containing protein [Riemerella columbina]|uniref:DUF3810 domain-containing protein n=1 Tax=Riemerella columbina TaxID=103810 RepID=UPI00036B3E45|nr:DUF3810 domain-containing protein [Riemerella columbina]